MGTVVTRRAVLAIATGVCLALPGCAADDDDGATLQPLPVEGNTMAPATLPSTTGSTATSTSTSPSTSTASGATTASGPTTTGGASTTTTTAGTTTTSVRASVGDWDGARFDAGTIAAVTDVAGAAALSFDRYSYAVPGAGTVDAGGMQAEPVAAWWRQSPFSNVRAQLRTFVLAPDVEVLTLDESGRAAACTDPPPATPPTPRWDTADDSALRGSAVAGAIATLTYSSTGQVTRIRLTHGC
ncbi:MAG: hypothetical protein ABW195_09070 [Ilumatobacteraceae bacterium]